MSWQDATVRRTAGAQPVVEVIGTVAARADELGVAAVVVQAETHGTAEGETLEVLGLLLPDGRTAVGFADDVDWVDGADPVWRDLVEDALFSGGGA